ncbi:MAG: SWIM zinc finger family protein [Cyanobium sp. CZS 48M]|nr:SWIM zinc finger family protein [Cyanobium sp. CZS48M]
MSPRQKPPARRWWSQRFIDVLEGYGLGGRMERGRRYARSGQVLSLEVGPGRLAARVQGSRRTPYKVMVETELPEDEEWAAIEAVFRQRLGWAAKLLAGEVPEDLETGFHQAGVDLFPARWSDLEAECSCPDWEVPCKHIAASLHVFAQRLDDDPWQLLAWRGREREALMQRLRPTVKAGAAAGPEEGLPPWWPQGLVARPGERLVIPDPLPPDPPARVLERLGPIPVPEALVQGLVELYCAITTPLPEPELNAEAED